METQSIKQHTRIDIAALNRRQVHLVVFGHGTVGSEFLKQFYKSQEAIAIRQNLDIKVIAIANSKQVLMQANGLEHTWLIDKIEKGVPYSIQDIIIYVKQHRLENVIVIDNTADETFTNHYETFVANGFHLVSSNKHKNTAPWQHYKQLREVLHRYDRHYRYETNVGAGLPLIDTITLLHQSGENITRIRGVFSGSLSYLFNVFSESNDSFSTVLKRAIQKGYTEPDPREDLCGMDVARKLLILARELELRVELNDVSVHNLIPKEVRALSKEQFLTQVSDLDTPFLIKKKNLKAGHVLRYIGDLYGDLSQEDGAILTVSLQEIPKNSMLGQLKGSDSIFEIYTESYDANPIVIQGAGAGAAVTARGVFGDVLRISNQLN